MNTNSEGLRDEIMLVLRAFDAENEEFTHYFSCSGGKFLNSIEFKGEFYDFEEEYKAENDIIFKRLAKRSAKLSAYKVLSRTTGKALPWGALTGIRPTKLAYTEKASGGDYIKLFCDLCVSEENTKLVTRILKAQEGVYKKGGRDLYVSLPFCPTKCDYCSFITAPIAKTEIYVKNYINCLIKELRSVKPYLTDLRLVYVGGGTPFVLKNSQLTPIYAAINAIFDGAVEYTVEAGRPDVFTEEKLKTAKGYGVTRLCVNPQTFNDATLEKIGRKHTS
ncbi:MAG: radical SAM protein, partial [Clostridia bacterium]|nr:radical SAM protein [Clostridia bacterium]